MSNWQDVLIKYRFVAAIMLTGALIFAFFLTFFTWNEPPTNAYQAGQYEILGATVNRAAYNAQKVKLIQLTNSGRASFADLRSWLSIVNREMAVCHLSIQNVTTQNLVDQINSALETCNQ